jgi:cyclic pyranopterin phosphate synthase
VDNAAMTKPQLIDNFGRAITYLRLSVTDRCDFRCTYCMAETMTFMPRSELLTLEELAFIGNTFIALGVNKIRITGGEPLIRRNIVSLFEQLDPAQQLHDLCLTTNASQLSHMASPLKEAGLKRINISLDSLKPDRFKHITRTGELAQVLKGIDAALAAGFKNIKLNAVILRGQNDGEIVDLVNFAMDKGLDISFIEEMPLGTITEHDRKQAFISSAEVRDIISQYHALVATTDTTGGPSRYWAIANSQTRVGFISPHSHNFCGDCNRVRLTASGRLLLCLGNEHSLDLRAVVRAHPFDTERLTAAIFSSLALKPEEHHFDLDTPPDIVRFMNSTGG